MRHDVEEPGAAMLVDLHFAASGPAHDVEDQDFQRPFLDDDLG
jgi:hypothetical protein